MALSPTCRYYPLFQSQPFSPPLNSRTRSQSACLLTLILDTPISPHITHPPNTNSSLIALHRNFYRKQFNTSFMLTIQPLSLSVDDLVHITHIRHHASHITHHTSRVVSSSRNVLSYHHHQLTSQSSLLCISITISYLLTTTLTISTSLHLSIS